MIQGTFGVIQGTFRVIQGTFRVIQGIGSLVQWLFAGIRTRVCYKTCKIITLQQPV